MVFDAGQVVLGQSNRALGDSWGTTPLLLPRLLVRDDPARRSSSPSTPLAEAGLFLGTAAGCVAAVILLGLRFRRCRPDLSRWPASRRPRPRLPRLPAAGRAARARPRPALARAARASARRCSAAAVALRPRPPPPHRRQPRG